MKTATKQSDPLDPDRLVDEALEETFPASDPISPGVGPGNPIPNRGDGRRVLPVAAPEPEYFTGLLEAKASPKAAAQTSFDRRPDQGHTGGERPAPRNSRSGASRDSEAPGRDQRPYEQPVTRLGRLSHQIAALRKRPEDDRLAANLLRTLQREERNLRSSLNRAD
jgi:hypothetical protein